MSQCSETLMPVTFNKPIHKDLRDLSCGYKNQIHLNRSNVRHPYRECSTRRDGSSSCLERNRAEKGLSEQSVSCY